MDFSKRDVRQNAETGVDLHLVDPFTKEPISDENGPCIVVVRGAASPTVQAAQRESARKLQAMKGDEEARHEVLEDVHNALIEAALPFVIGFKNISFEGEDPSGDEALTRKVLGTTFPAVRAVKDGEGSPVLDENGDPKFEQSARTFAEQIIAFAGDAQNYAGNGSAG